MPQTVLVVAAHPDDEVLGCGGTAARRAQQGDDVFLAVFGEGITSRYARREQGPRAEVDALHARARAAARIIGARDLLLFDLPDNRFDTVPLLDVIKKVEDLITRLRPGVVYTHHAGDLNVDHVVLNRAVLTATRTMVGCPVRELYAFEVPSSTEWHFGTEAAFRPNVFVDIHDTLEAKVAAMQAYESEARPFPHPRSPEALRALARWRGSTAGLPAAEAFVLLRSVW
jgi:LmbE family N-acetylglucosaminyl deacetylase